MQLTVLGYILVPIFTYNMWWLVLLYSFFMLYVGCLEAVQRPAYTFQVSTSPDLLSQLAAQAVTAHQHFCSSWCKQGVGCSTLQRTSA